ncbi:transcriptional regulator [Klebsiella variicola]|nr:transcriptional regulator [Klebsiella variicola]
MVSGIEVPDVALLQAATQLSEEDVKKVQGALSLAKALEDKKLWRRGSTVYTSMLGMTTTANELWLLAKMHNRCLRMRRGADYA